MEQLDRITHQPDVMGGKACIRGMSRKFMKPSRNSAL
jgi:hypothetical protein